LDVYREIINIRTSGETDIVDITDNVRNVVKNSGMHDGIVNVFGVGSTCAISTIEYEPGLKTDFPRFLERIIPKNIEYEHHKRWGDYNGHSHVRATLLKSSLSIPLVNGEPHLGTWQQIVFIELDVRPRTRKIIVTVVGK
jgi:secondary thiamine-phosphate synthase enzyme